MENNYNMYLYFFYNFLQFFFQFKKIFAKQMSFEQQSLFKYCFNTNRSIKFSFNLHLREFQWQSFRIPFGIINMHH